MLYICDSSETIDGCIGEGWGCRRMLDARQEEFRLSPEGCEDILEVYEYVVGAQYILYRCNVIAFSQLHGLDQKAWP